MGDLVEVAFVGDEFQAGMIQALLEDHGIPSLVQQVTPSGPQLGYGLMNPGGGARRVMVHPDRADRARALIEATTAEGESSAEPVNAEYLADAAGGRKPRNYGLIGGYARAWFWSFLAMAGFFVVWLLLREVGVA
jgi:Putative prokaryotic signal transducing protein